MATKGRKPTPTAIKELEGNPGKRELNKNRSGKRLPVRSGWNRKPRRNGDGLRRRWKPWVF